MLISVHQQISLGQTHTAGKSTRKYFLELMTKIPANIACTFTSRKLKSSVFNSLAVVEKSHYTSTEHFLSESVFKLYYIVCDIVTYHFSMTLL